LFLKSVKRREEKSVSALFLKGEFERMGFSK
jgi:hypothetical protein